MYSKKHSFWVGMLLLLFLFVVYPAHSFSEITIERAVKKEVQKRVIDKEITILPQLNKITTGFGKDKFGELFVLRKITGQSILDYEDESYTFKEGIITFQ